jgi:hypothetical protein
MPAGLGGTSGEAGSYRLEVTLGAAVPPPSNDVCGGAQALQFTNDAVSVLGSTLNALNDSYGTCEGRLSPDVVYSFTLSGPRAVEAKVTSRTYGYAPVLRMTTDCQTPNQNIVCRASPSTGGGAFATFAYLQGTFLPAGRSFKKRLTKYFSKVVKSKVIWRNLPPAFVYRCWK